MVSQKGAEDEAAGLWADDRFGPPTQILHITSEHIYDA
jgi:hypothetical protein